MRHLKIKTVEKNIESVERFGKWYEQQGGFWEVWCAQKQYGVPQNTSAWCAQKHFSIVCPETLSTYLKNEEKTLSDMEKSSANPKQKKMY